MADQGSPRKASRERVTDQLDEGRPGTIADRYEVVRTLGQGGMGAVYQARDTRLDRLVAIKTIRPEYLASRLASQRFFREARALARLNHPNILTLHDYGQHGDLHYLVMELGGHDLQHLLENQGGPLPLEQALPLALGVSRALEYAHGRGVIHRDLKPANIVVGHAPDAAGGGRRPVGVPAVKVMDFGLAKVQGASAITAPLARIGTPQYMSPEQALGREADERSDLYALGVVLYELCTGVRPFDSDDPRAILSQHLNLAPVPPSVFNPELPQALDALILRLLEKDPAQRLASAGEVVGALDAITGELQQPPAQRGAASSIVSHSPLGRLPTRTPLVGRVDELGFLKVQFDAAAAGGGGRLIFVSGDPGVGKTRLARELGLYARLRGGVFLEGHYLRDGTPPYGPWIEALWTGLRDLKREDLAQVVGPHGPELSQLFPELVERLGPFPPAPALAPEDQRRRLFDGIAALVSNLSQQAPLVLLLDDLQWAPGLGLLTHLARRLGESRALIVGAYRDQEFKEQPALVREWAELNRARLLTQVTLAPLAKEPTAELVAHYFGEGPAAQLRDPVYRQTRGNAFFVEEVLRSLAETGAVRPGAAGWEVIDPSRVSIPDSMKLAIEERATRLGEAVRDILVQAAVLGQEFSFSALQVLTGLPEDDLMARIEQAVAARLLSDRSTPSEERYAFWDDQVQEVLYESIPPPRRRRYHRRAGQGLEALYADRLDDQLEELARHFAAGNDPEKAADYAFRAAARNDRLFNWSRSLSLYRMAATIWDRLGGHLDRRAAAYEKLGDLSYKSSLEAPQAIEYLRQALALYEEMGNRRKLAAIHSQIAREYYSGANLRIYDSDKALEHAHLARTILEAEPASLPLGWVYVVLAFAYGVKLEWPASLEWARRAIELGERLQNSVLANNARVILGRALIDLGEIAEGLATFEQGWQLSVQHNFAFQADYYRYTATLSSALLRDPGRGLTWAARRDYGTVSALFLAPPHLAMIHALAGDFQKAAQVRQELQTAWEALGQPAHGYHPGELGCALLRQGDWQGARALLESGLQWAIDSRCTLMAADAARFLGELLLETGEAALAERHLRWAVDQYRSGHDRLNELTLLPLLCALYVRTGRLEVAQTHLGEAQAILARGEEWGGTPGTVALAEGLVRAAEGRWPEAGAAFDQAAHLDQRHSLPWDEAKVYYEWANALLGQIDQRNEPLRWARAWDLLSQATNLWEPMGARPWVAKAQYASAALLVARNQPGDREKALELLDQVLATVQAVETPRLMEQALALKIQAQGLGTTESERRTKKYPDGLTAREVEVLRRIAVGRTNKEIASELVLSVATVERHITNIYAKIGARGRAEAIAYALNYGLFGGPP